MKSIQLRQHDRFGTLPIIRELMANSPNRPFGFDEMRLRVAVVDRIDAHDGSATLPLEDAEHLVLADALKSAQWTVADKHILLVADDILKAASA